ncbi:MAG: cupin domain-containing protein [Actinomycetes bacterium]
MSYIPKAVHLREGDGDAWWFLATRMTTLVDKTQSSGGLTLLMCEGPAGFGPPRHIHKSEDEAFFLLDGAMHVRCGDQQWDLEPGGFVWLPRGIEHTFIITKPGKCLQLTTPAGFESFVQDIGIRPNGPGLPPPSEPDIPRLAASSAAHGYDLVGPPLDPAAFGVATAVGS